MQEFVIEREGGRPVRGRAHVGVVASGNLEVLCESPSGPGARVLVRTTVGGYETIWRTVVARFLERHPIAADVEINDFGATPATVSLRLEQALEMLA
ncbi:MAG: malonate decarboxylase acyl carrier protein [Vulcanimicrobiaceae bacterium]